MMTRAWVLRAVLLAVALLQAARRVEAKGKAPRRNSAMHKRSSRSSRSARSTPKGRPSRGRKAKREAYYEEEEDDDEEDDDDYGEARSRSRAVEPYYRPRRKPTGPSFFQRAQAMAGAAAEKALETSKVAASRAKVLAAEAAVKGHEASRLAKAYYSSEYEKFLLTATWPSDQRVSPQLAKRLVESVARFPARPHALPDDDPYRVTLRKLWKKMVEKDWRTTTKALYLLHALSRSTPTKNARALSRTLKSMVGDSDPKSGKKYFSRRELITLREADDDDGRGGLVDAYAGFVLRRALLFAGKFEDVSPPSKKKKAKSASAAASDDDCDASSFVDGDAARRAQNALLVADHALQFVAVALADGDPRDAHLVVVSCLELVVADLVEAWKTAGVNVAKVADEVIASYDLTSDDAKTALAAVAKYASMRSKVKKAAKAALKTLRFFDLRVSADLDAAAVDDAKLEAALAKGDGAPDEPAAAAASDDEDEDEEEEEEEEEDDDEEEEDEDEEEEDDDDDDEEEEEDDDDDEYDDDEYDEDDDE